VSAAPEFQSSHDYPWYERLGYTSVADFFAGYTWSHAVKKNVLFTVGRRVEYTVILPITDVTTGNLIFNYHPLASTGHSPIVNLVETDTDFFETV
jgi:hypothetical protein